MARLYGDVEFLSQFYSEYFAGICPLHLPQLPLIKQNDKSVLRLFVCYTVNSNSDLSYLV